jgi:hypothetical protein
VQTGGRLLCSARLCSIYSIYAIYSVLLCLLCSTLSTLFYSVLLCLLYSALPCSALLLEFLEPGGIAAPSIFSSEAGNGTSRVEEALGTSSAWRLGLPAARQGPHLQLLRFCTHSGSTPTAPLPTNYA